MIVSHNRDFLDPITDKVIEFYPAKKTPRIFLGNLSDFIDKKSQELADVTSTGKAEPPLDHKGIKKPSLHSSRKEQRKIEGQIRQQKADAIKPIQQKLEEIEHQIADLEVQKQALENDMKDPDFFKEKEQSMEASKMHGEISGKIEKHYSDWADTSDELEKTEQEFNSKLATTQP
jgi:ATP-binding cassette subfamily F protein 3